MSDNPVPAALQVARLFEKLGLDYWLGGSLASSIHGEPRSTHDVNLGDIVVVVGESRPSYSARGWASS